jgi:hypothetical protein
MTSRFQPPPIIRSAERLVVEIEQAVRRFPRYHRYQIGADLRAKALEVFTRAGRAWRDRSDKALMVGGLVWAIDELKQFLQVAKLLRAFGSFGQFEVLARQAEELGAQAGGWLRRLISPNVQNAQANGVVQRDKKLSTRTALARANS